MLRRIDEIESDILRALESLPDIHSAHYHIDRALAELSPLLDILARRVLAEADEPQAPSERRAS